MFLGNPNESISKSLYLWNNRNECRCIWGIWGIFQE